MTFLKPSLNWLLPLIPVTIALDYFRSQSHTWIFICACFAVIPLARWMGKATEELANKTGEGIGGLLNATFGNAAELIIAWVALREGLLDLVKASLIGAIIGNTLLILGVSCLAGGLRYKKQSFNVTAARSQSSMLWLSSVALIIPATYHSLSGAALPAERNLSRDISIVLLATYGLSLLFSLHTHRQLFIGVAAESSRVQDPGHASWSLAKALGVLFVAGFFDLWVSEILVGRVESVGQEFGMSNVFLGVIVIAVIGNTAEHSTAVMVALKNRMDLAIGIAIGGSIQIVLFVAPILVLSSYWVSPEPMDLVFSTPEVLAVVLAAAITAQIAGDGESNWLEGVQLLSVYIILALIFFFLP